MRFISPLIAGVSLATTAPLGAQAALPPGIWTNTEDEYFAEEEGREEPEWIALEVAADGRWRHVDAFGAAQGSWSDAAIPGLAAQEGGGWQIGDSEIRQARAFSCWISVRKFAGKPDGSEDWTFKNKLPIFDQGGRIFLPGNGDAPDVTFRMRNVTWAKGSRNAPSLVLYVHKDDPVRAASYSWAGPDSERVGINLRWVQGSCARDAEAIGATEESLVAAGERWRAHYEAGDWAALRALYTDDAVLMTQGQAKIEGADNIVAFLQRLGNAGAEVAFAFAPERTTVVWPQGHVTAKYRMDIAFPDQAPVVVTGRSYLVYKWQEGGWKLWRDMDNLAPDVTPDSFDEKSQ